VLKGINGKELEQNLGTKMPSIPSPNYKFLRQSAIVAWTRLVEWGQVSVKDFGDQQPINRLLEKKTAILEKIHYLSSEYSPTLVHNDIKGEHILADPQSGRITGILDWADAVIGSPAGDIAGLVLTVGIDPAKESPGVWDMERI
jgi:aminoglycoside phosphotransferase (APT) family kinase protein